MKSMKKYISFLTVLVVILFFAIAGLNAQSMAPSDPPGGPELGDEPIGGGAPISGGTLILIGLAAAYGGKKVYHLVRQEEE